MPIPTDESASAPIDAWVHADDSFDRGERRLEAVYFHARGPAEVILPAGKVVVEVMKGLDYRVERRELRLEAESPVSVVVRLVPLVLPAHATSRWVSGDLHVHMNYGGAYRNTPGRLVAQGEAENLGVLLNLIVNKEQRIPDIGYFSGQLDPASTATTLLKHDQEFHTSFWGHLGLLNLRRNLLLPDYAAYPNTAAASLAPDNSSVARLAREQGALIGYVHPFEAEPDPSPVPHRAAGRAGDPGVPPERITHALPVDVALGNVDYLEVLGFSDHHATAAVWYRLLNLGFRIPAGAGTDAMANFASLHGPLGLNRVYVQVPHGPLQLDAWLEGLRRGRTFATNGPLLRFTLGGESPGGELKLPRGEHQVPFTATLRSMVPVDHFEVVCNGRVAFTAKLDGARDSADISGTLSFSQSGWCVLRAWSEQAQHPILDIYPYATTSPVYITVGSTPACSSEDVAYFLAWIDRLMESADAYPDWNTPAEKAEVLATLRRARAVYEAMTK